MKFCALSHFGARSLPAGKHADGQGLWLVKSDKSRGKWVLRVVVGGKRREMGLGRWPDVSITEAREKAAGARKLSRDAVDPVEARRNARRVVHRLTVKQAIDSCFEARKAELKGDGEAGRWMSPLSTHIIPKIGDDAIEELDQHRLKEVLEPMWHTKSDSARKALNRLNLTLQHAAALGLEVDLQACLKARALLGKQRHEPKHIPALPYAEAPAFYKWLLTQDGVAARALRFLMLTLARSGEVRFASIAEIVGDVWTIPATRTKTGKEHRIPLVKSAQAIAANKGLLFTNSVGKPISDMTMSMLMRREGYEARPHGFRATFRTWVEEQTDTPFEIKESILGHVVDSPVVGAYQRSDRLYKRRKLMEAWELFLLT